MADGWTELSPFQGIKMTKKKGMLISDQYTAARHRPGDGLVAASYLQLLSEMYLQYAFATEHLQIMIEPFTGSDEPYDGSRSMRRDVLKNRHLYFLPTDGAFGSDGAKAAFNWMQLSADIEINGHRLVMNDVFRAVHDIFGHAFPGTSFGPNGEERAWYCHACMCMPLARPALTTETRGQNCWVNFGPHMRKDDGDLVYECDAGWLPQAERPFAQQKNALLPSLTSGIHLNQMANGDIHAVPFEDWSHLSCLDACPSMRAA